MQRDLRSLSGALKLRGYCLSVFFFVSGVLAPSLAMDAQFGQISFSCGISNSFSIKYPESGHSGQEG